MEREGWREGGMEGGRERDGGMEREGWRDYRDGERDGWRDGERGMEGEGRRDGGMEREGWRDGGTEREGWRDGGMEPLLPGRRSERPMTAAVTVGVGVGAPLSWRTLSAATSPMLARLYPTIFLFLFLFLFLLLLFFEFGWRVVDLGWRRATS